MRHIRVISFHVDHFGLMLSFGIWKVVVCENVVTMWHNMLVADDWWPTTDLVEMVKSSKQKKGNREAIKGITL
jgi:hypothetical protein